MCLYAITMYHMYLIYTHTPSHTPSHIPSHYPPGEEEHVSGWDLVYDNGYIEIDPAQCGYRYLLLFFAVLYGCLSTPISPLPIYTRCMSTYMSVSA